MHPIIFYSSIASPYFYGAPYEPYHSWARQHPNEQLVSHSEYSYRDGILRAPSHHSAVWPAENVQNGLYSQVAKPQNGMANGLPLPPNMPPNMPPNVPPKMGGEVLPHDLYSELPPHPAYNGLYNMPPPVLLNGKPPPHNYNGLPPGVRPSGMESSLRQRRMLKKPKFTFKRGIHNKNKNKGWRGSDPGHLPIHSTGSIPVSYNSKRYSANGSLSSINGYYSSFGMTSSDGMLFPQGSRWRPPGEYVSGSSSNSQNNSARNSLIRRSIGDPTYPYKTHSSDASTPSSGDYSDINRLYGAHHGVKKPSSKTKGKKKR